VHERVFDSYCKGSEGRHPASILPGVHPFGNPPQYIVLMNMANVDRRRSATDVQFTALLYDNNKVKQLGNVLEIYDCLVSRTALA